MGMKARCQCGTIQFETPTDKPLEIYICHCTECRHQSSSAFGITAKFKYFELPDSLIPLIGIYTRATLKGRQLECMFCKTCGSRLLHRFCDDVPGGSSARTNVKGGCLEGLDAEMMRDAIHIWCQEAIVPIPEGVLKFDKEPWEST